MKYTLNSMRLTGPYAEYYKDQFQQFADYMEQDLTCDPVSICFGKQDSRGSISITIFDSRHCVPMKRHFGSKDELLGFVEGYNKAKSGEFYL